MDVREPARYAYRICPCVSYDIEGVQSWLEDMAAAGLVLEEDGIFAGVFTFRKTTPQTHRYRLVPVKKKKGFFSDSPDAPEEEEQEFSAQCGWEYLLRYGSFYIYRATDPEARPLHTDPVVQALAIEQLKKRQQNTYFWIVVLLLLRILLNQSPLPAPFMTAVIAGPVPFASIFCLGIWAVVWVLRFLLRLSGYRKRLQMGDALENRKDWKRRALAVYCAKGIPWVLVLVLAVSWGISWKAAEETVPLTEVTEAVPFVTLQELFPEMELDRSIGFGDYNTMVHYRNALAENYEWNENADIPFGEGSFAIVRLHGHITPAPWIAEGLADDYYRREATRYRGKRFEDLDVPETGLDSVRVFSSYGVVHVLIQHENMVFDAVVQIHDGTQSNYWQRWLSAMEKKLLG